MSEMRKEYIFVEKIQRKRSVERSRRICGDSIVMNHKQIGFEGTNWVRQLRIT
jgi:hypothetical protein